MLAPLHRNVSLIGLAAVAFVLLRGALILPAADAARTGPSMPPAQAEWVGERLATPDPDVLAAHLARRYRIARVAADHMVGTALEAGSAVGLDPLLILAVIAVESRFNPVASSVAGAKGLMQIIPEMHEDKLLQYGGEEAVLDPTVNILVGARILKEYVRRTGGLEAGLQFYNGAAQDVTARYARKVMGELELLRRVLQHAESTEGSAKT